MEKINLTKVFLVIVIGILIGGCNKNDDDQPVSGSDITGVWTCTALDYTGTTETVIMGQSISADFVGEGYDINFTLTFTENPNEATSDGYYNVKLTTTTFGQSTTQYLEMQNFTYTGIWSKNGNEISITQDGETSVATITELTDSNLKVTITDIQTITNNGATATTTTNLTLEFTK